MSATKIPTVLVVDDQRELAEVVRRGLAQAGFDAVVAHTGESALDIARSHRPDLMVLDLGMPGMDGLQVCQAVRRDPRLRKLPILVLSARAGEADRVLGLETGADDYLVKPFGSRELVARVRALLRRVAAEEHEAPVLRDGNFEMNFERHSASLGGVEVPFTASEYQIVALLALQPHRVFTRDEILEHLGGSESDDAVTERTVDVHINAIRRKLASGNGRIVTVRGVGYKFRPEETGGAAAADR